MNRERGVDPIVESLIQARKKRKVTQTDLAELLGIPQSTIGRIEAGITSPSLETVSKIASMLGLTLCFDKAGVFKGDPYGKIPVFENARFLLRGIEDKDANALLRVYSNPLSWPYFNGDNCHGDDFHYQGAERMEQAIAFWRHSFENRWFARWCIEDKLVGEAIGTIEAFRRDKKDHFNDCAILRLDLRHDYESKPIIQNILSLILPSVCGMFGTRKAATKTWADGKCRTEAIRDLGFALSEEPLIGDDGTKYFGYYEIPFGRANI